MLMLLIAICGFSAGMLGSLIGIGGGIIIVPILVLIFNLPIKSAVAISLISVCATSIGGASRYLVSGQTDFRLGLFLETTTVAGAICGGLIAILVNQSIIAIMFSILLFYTAIAMIKKKENVDDFNSEDTRAESGGLIKYIVLTLSFAGGILSSLLGVGGGIIKVPIMNLILKLPIKVSAATSTYMIGSTTAAGSIVYLIKGVIDYQVAAPLILGTYLGSGIGAKLSGRIYSNAIKYIFIIVLLYSAVTIALKHFGINLL
ncbi:MAG: sulfite exporter TauE/SafE family protein [candidate division Zixibacteria bacterium]|nr:sulfite exporter TauE/SafE family protein [candidate division Zixibacteria bacterium]